MTCKFLADADGCPMDEDQVGAGGAFTTSAAVTIWKGRTSIGHTLLVLKPTLPIHVVGPCAILGSVVEHQTMYVLLFSFLDAQKFR